MSSPSKELLPERTLTISVAKACDNESFLHAPAARAAHRRIGVRLWQIPPRSPDLNPVEKYWSWLRRTLRTKDLADFAARRPPLGKMAYTQRVRRVFASAPSQAVARKIASGLRKVCAEVVHRNGAASRG